MQLTHLSDAALISNFREHLLENQDRLVLELELIAELDRRKLFRECASLWSYLVSEFGMEEWQAERKIRAARLMIKYPEVKAGLERGKLNLSLLELASGCAHREKLDEAEFSELLKSVWGLSCRAAKRELARLYPLTHEIPRDRVIPINETHSELRFVAPNELLEKLDEIKGLLAHSHPGSSMAERLELLAIEYRERHHPEERAQRAKPPTAPRAETESRTPTQAQVHELVRTQGYVCSYEDPVTKRRCSSTHGLEIDHRVPWSQGGRTELSNLRFLCKNHHRRVSFLEFGDPGHYFKRA